MKIGLQFYGPDALVLLVCTPDGQDLSVVQTGPGKRTDPENLLCRDLVDEYRKAGQLVEVLHTPESWGCEILPR